jgi:hypothetical protein
MSLLYANSNKLSQKTLDPLQEKKLDSNRSRVVLSRAAARDVFIARSNLGLESAHRASIRLAAKYHISSKAIRDIWKGRSWLDATFDLWNEEDRPARRVIGRPKGKKDSKPRAKGQAREEQEAHGNILPHAASDSRPISMAAFGYFDECRFQEAPQFNTSSESDSCYPSLPFSLRKQTPRSMDSIEDRAECLLPSFRSLIQDMGLAPAIPNPFAHQAASAPPSLRFTKDCGSFPTPSMFGGAGSNGSLLALMACHLLCSRRALAVSRAPFGFGAGLSFT